MIQILFVSLTNHMLIYVRGLSGENKLNFIYLAGLLVADILLDGNSGMYDQFTF